MTLRAKINEDGKSVTTINPFLHKGDEKPQGEVLTSYDSGKTFDDSVEWAESRTCMMAGIAGGHGYFGEGWATSQNSQTDTGLICDDPCFWVYVDEFDQYEQAQRQAGKVYEIEFPPCPAIMDKETGDEHYFPNLMKYTPGTTHNIEVVNGKAKVL